MKDEIKTYKQCWYTEGLNAYLSSLGYVQWATREPMLKDYDKGKAYFFDEQDKVFGLCGFIALETYDEACKIRDDFKKIIESLKK